MIKRGTLESILFGKDHFYQYGEIRSISLVPKQQCAFVQYTTRAAAETAAEKTFNKLILGGRRLTIKWGRSQGRTGSGVNHHPENYEPVPGLPPALPELSNNFFNLEPGHIPLPNMPPPPSLMVPPMFGPPPIPPFFFNPPQLPPFAASPVAVSTSASTVTSEATKTAVHYPKNGAGVIDAITWHQYYISGYIAKPKDFLNPAVFDYLREQIDIVNNITIGLKIGDKPRWLGETSSAYGGGAPNLSNTFIGSFIWIDKLGLSAKMGIKVVVRQSIFKGYYALLDDNYDPNPEMASFIQFRRSRRASTSSIYMQFSFEDYGVRAQARFTKNKHAKTNIRSAGQQEHALMQTKWGISNSGFGASHTGTLFNNNNHRLDGTASASKNFGSHGLKPDQFGGRLDYSHNPSRTSAFVGADRTRHFGTDVSAGVKHNLYQNKNFGVDAVGSYNRHFGGPGGTGRPDGFVGIQASGRKFKDPKLISPSLLKCCTRR
ncbi:hypothetical protein NQ315_007520 [Exocentrus adspersus]|uniref:RRM domain-containing protein n=1 Tax=Exocentrus adspersus TaxID=1586481 RepID=A0AAV8W8P6_9CUCU|nr:hypothetical protein NQ315_007520 [Exocentrus adspersus]